MLQRGSGVLLHISSLPGSYGIGDFGAGARRFVDFISDMGFSVWQVLPLCPVGAGNSPYSSPSAFALNPLFLDGKDLVKQGLIPAKLAEELEYPGTPHTADYAYAARAKQQMVTAAMANIPSNEIADFLRTQFFWLADYALYMSGRASNGGKPFWEWEVPPREADVTYYYTEQYLLWKQWAALKQYAGEKGVKLFGDMPIYVSRDSADFYAHPELFQTDADGHLKNVAGVPPDYFSADGQLWGNPLYDWEVMKADGYRWWLARIGHSLELYDILRIDHFRGFHRYWAVPGDAATAREGVWMDGPAMDLFRKVEQQFSHPAIVAEDLGTVDDGLLQFLQETGYPGMRVMQFGFDSLGSIHLPYKYNANCVAYTGTHDNDTMLGWLWAIPMEEKRRLLRYCRYDGEDWGRGGADSPAIREILQTLWMSAAGLVMVPIQDMLGWGSDTRLNIPGQPEGNWIFRITEDAYSQVDADFFRSLNQTYDR